MLSSEDPVRVLQQFNSLDLISGGRAELMVGRGSFTESFPLFGYDLAHYDELFAEKLELLLQLRTGEPTSWQGRHPRTAQRRHDLPGERAGSAADLAGGGRQSAVSGARRSAGPALGARPSSAASRRAWRRSRICTAGRWLRAGTAHSQ